MADRAHLGQNIKKELAERWTITQGMRILKPNHGESLYIWMMRTVAPDLLKLHPIQDVEVFPAPDDRRVDFSFLPIPVVIEIQGCIHNIDEKQAKDWLKINALQLAGCMVLQYTPHQLERDPWPAAEQTRQALEMMRDRTCALANRNSYSGDY